MTVSLLSELQTTVMRAAQGRAPRLECSSAGYGGQNVTASLRLSRARHLFDLSLPRLHLSACITKGDEQTPSGGAGAGAGVTFLHAQLLHARFFPAASYIARFLHAGSYMPGPCLRVHTYPALTDPAWGFPAFHRHPRCRENLGSVRPSPGRLPGRRFSASRPSAKAVSLLAD